MSEIYRCLACQSKDGQARADGSQDWQWMLIAGGHRAGPFCSLTCAAAWTMWPEKIQLASIFGDAERAAVTLQRIEEGRFVQDTPRVGDPLWMLDFDTAKHRNTQRNDKTGLAGAVCPSPTQKSVSGMTNPDSCPDCTFLQPRGWRQVVAR